MILATRVRYWLPIVPLLALLGATYWLNQQVQPQADQPDSSKRHDPDTIVENFSAIKLNEQGVPRLIMAARKMLHYPDDDSTTLEVPRLASLAADRQTIHTIAQRGIISSKGDEVFLHDAVEVLREANRQQPELRMQTEYLHIIPDKDIADTDRAVTIVDAYTTTHATGLEMDNNTRTLKLLSQVRSEHVPHKK